MSQQNLKPPANSKDQSETASLENVISSLSKAVKTLTFYPAEHPLHSESIVAASAQLRPLLHSGELVLKWSRDACTAENRPSLRSASITAKALAREMLTRKLQRLTILPNVTEKDLQAFLALIATDATAINSNGGIEAEMARAGIITIGANEVDLSILSGMRLKEASSGNDETVSGIPGEVEQELNENAEGTTEETGEGTEENSEEEEVGDSGELPAVEMSVLGMDLLLGMLAAEKREPQYLQLARDVIDSADILKRQEAFATLLPALEALLDELASDNRPATQKEYTRYALEQIADGTMTPFLLDHIEMRSVENAALMDRLCATIGKSLAYPLIQRLCIAESLHVRKILANALTMTGEAAIPALLMMLKDERWYVVRNIVTILGEIGSIEAVTALQATAEHYEPKVRKEIIKSLLKINSHATENILISLLHDPDNEVQRQAIYSLGAIRSRSAVKHLVNIVAAPDTFLKELALKKQAIIALGRIGDRQVSSFLLDLLTSRRWLAPSRWQEIKVAAASALGQLGDENAIPLLKRMSNQRTPLGKACGDAADNLERLAK